LLTRLLGTDGGAFYNFYSGIFGVLVITAGLLANAYVTARRHNCHQVGCWRVGRYPVQGTSWTACRRHHPAPPQRRQRFYLGERPGRG
jgi:hypothetical protein